MKRKQTIAIISVLLLLCISINPAEQKKPVQKRPPETDQHAQPWFKNAVIFNLDIKVFKDSDGDGIGDIRGLTRRLWYLDSLGVDVIWLAPFQPTPGKDDGYDVSDYYGIDQRLGSWDDLAELMREAKRHHLKVIMDLVLNHSSNEHPWFIRSKDPSSPFRNWYSWSLKRPSNYNKGVAFPGVQKETWTYDSVAKAWYYHRFYNFQPDLNANEPAVQAEVKNIIRFWMRKGLDGFRIDAVPFFIEVPQTKGTTFKRRGTLLNPIRQLLDSIDPQAILLGEINVPPVEDSIYFGEHGERMNMMLNFFVNQHLFYALATGNASTLKKALLATGNNPPGTAWGQFLRNHDEVDLGRLSRHERHKVYKAFGPLPCMQLYHRGIRRRLAPMLQTREKLELAYTLLFALPSTPLIRYGEELGMGDDLSLKERLSVRTPMQWTSGSMASFTPARRAIRPVIDSGTYSCKKINAAGELHDKNSLLRWMMHLTRLRRSTPEIAYGSWQLLSGSKHVLAIQYTYQEKKVILLHNLSQQTVNFLLKKEQRPVCFWPNGITDQPMRTRQGWLLRLPPWGYRWYRVK